MCAVLGGAVATIPVVAATSNRRQRQLHAAGWPALAMINNAAEHHRSLCLSFARFPHLVVFRLKRLLGG